MRTKTICLLLAGMLLLSDTAAAKAPKPPTSDEVILEDPEGGIHRYESPTLRIEAIRRYDPEKKLTWTVADIVTTGEDVFHVIPSDSDKPMRLQARKYVEEIAKENGVVLGLSSDFSFSRLASRQVGGVVIRNGIIYSDKPRSVKSTLFPNLDLLALFADGDMKVFQNREKTAKELIAMGVIDVLAFGPILVLNGEINETDVRKCGRYREPRIGIGMVERGHYKVIMVEGRLATSKGITLAGLAQLFIDEGCAMAFNLDGGQTATLCFMGKQIIWVGNMKKMSSPARKTNEIIGIGYSSQVKPPENKKK